MQTTLLSWFSTSPSHLHLPNPLNQLIEQRELCEAGNDGVKEQLQKSNRKKYGKRMTGEQRLEVAKLALKDKAIGKKYPHLAPRSISQWKGMLQKMLASGRKVEEIKTLQEIKLGRRPKAGHFIDAKAREYIVLLRSAGVPINASVIIGALQGMINKYGHQGHKSLEVKRSWAYSLARRLKLVKRAGTKKANKLPEDWQASKDNYLKRIRDTMRKYNIPEHLVINFDETGSTIVPSHDLHWLKKGQALCQLLEKMTNGR